MTMLSSAIITDVAEIRLETACQKHAAEQDGDAVRCDRTIAKTTSVLWKRHGFKIAAFLSNRHRILDNAGYHNK